MSFNDTVDLERSLLRTLTKSIIMCRKYVQSVREEWFTSDERAFVFRILMENFRNSKAVLTGKLYKYEVDKRIEDEERKHYLGEWNFIEAITVSDPPEALIDRLREAHTGRSMMGAIEEVVLKAEAGDIVEAISLFKRTAVSLNIGTNDQPIVEITDYEHRLKLVQDKKAHPEKYLGIKTGFKTFDKRTGGLFPKELTLIAGVTGLGKSTLVKQLQYGIITENVNKNVLHIANEESQEQVETKFDALMTEIPYLSFKLATITDDEIEVWEEVMGTNLKKPGIGRVFIKEVPAFTDATLIEQAYRELESKGIKIHVIVVDHLPHVIPIMKAWGENDEKAKAAADLKQLSKDLNCSVVVPTQAATEVEAKQQKGRRAGKLDVYGSKAQVHVANTFIIITDKGKVVDPTLEEWEQDVNWLADIKKNRDGPPFCFRCRHYVKFGKVEEVFDHEEQEDDEEHAAADDEAEEAAKVAAEGAEDEDDGESGEDEEISGEDGQAGEDEEISGEDGQAGEDAAAPRDAGPSGAPAAIKKPKGDARQNPEAEKPVPLVKKTTKIPDSVRKNMGNQ